MYSLSGKSVLLYLKKLEKKQNFKFETYNGQTCPKGIGAWNSNYTEQLNQIQLQSIFRHCLRAHNLRVWLLSAQFCVYIQSSVGEGVEYKQ